MENINKSIKAASRTITKTKGAFNNHVDIILVFFDHPPTPVDIFFLTDVDKNGKF